MQVVNVVVNETLLQTESTENYHRGNFVHRLIDFFPAWYIRGSVCKHVLNETLTQVSFIVLYNVAASKGVDDCIRVLVPREQGMQSAGVPDIDRCKKYSLVIWFCGSVLDEATCTIDLACDTAEGGRMGWRGIRINEEWWCLRLLEMVLYCSGLSFRCVLCHALILVWNFVHVLLPVLLIWFVRGILWSPIKLLDTCAHVWLIGPRAEPFPEIPTRQAAFDRTKNEIL